MSENPYTMNSLGPVWQQGYEARQAALQSQLERMPCGHRQCDWVVAKAFGETSAGKFAFEPGYCLSCRAVQEAVRRARLEEALIWHNYMHDEDACEGDDSPACNRLAELRISVREGK